MRVARLRSLLAVVVLGAAAVAVQANPAAAIARIPFPAVDAGGHVGHMGLDDLANLGTAYAGGFTAWDANGNVAGGGPAASGIVNAHLELYPDSTAGGVFQDNYDAWAGPVGGAHIWLRPVNGASLGTVPLPQANNGAFRADGTILSSNGAAAGRLKILWFQLYNLKPIGGGYEVGAFGLSTSRVGTWTAGMAWPGTYIMDVTDTASGTHLQGLMDLASGQTPVLDLDAYCMGMGTCTYSTAAPPTAGGGYHPLAPTRLLDSRDRALGPLGPGDGRSADPNPDVRLENLQRHELKVTGVASIPEHGVSAVLLNVTAVAPTKEGWIGVYPRLPQSQLFFDQSWFRTDPPTSNLNFVTGDVVPNLVMARVGAGGIIRLENLQGNVHVAVDVVGWFDSATGNGGDGFVGVVPSRLLDTRSNVGGIGGRFSSDETRELTVVGTAGVPRDATAVVLNVTEADAGGPGYITVYPGGTARPKASNLNMTTGQTRPNLVVSKVGANGKVAFVSALTSSDLVVDVVGYYTGSGGGKTYALAPNRIMDSRDGNGTLKRGFALQETRDLQVAGRGGVPANATAVIMNVTGTGGQFGNFITVWPSGVARPTASNLNLTPGDTAPNLVMVKLGAGGNVSIYDHTGGHVIADVVGYVA